MQTTPPSILPAPLREALNQLGSMLAYGGRVAEEVDIIIGLFAQLPAETISKAALEIRAQAWLYGWRKPQSALAKLFTRRPTDKEQLDKVRGLEYIFLFHGDGRIREAALLKISGGLPNPFIFAAVGLCLNDWVEQVRSAAALCAGRNYVLTKPAIIARTAKVFLVGDRGWSRWHQAQRLCLGEAFKRADVGEYLAEIFINDATGRQATMLRYALQNANMDSHLERIARQAVQPSVRAVALQTLIDGKANWPSGRGWEWIDKPMGERRWKTTYSQRPLTVTCDKFLMLGRGINDRSAIVRNMVLTAVMVHQLGAQDALSFARRLIADPVASVRQRAQFIVKSSASDLPSG